MSTKARILVVEDERDIAELISFNLQRDSYLVSTALTGEEGLKQAKTVKPDLVLLDLMLPGMSGQDVCRALKSDRSTAGIPIIMLTARDDDIDIVTGLEMGADDYITKPFSPKVLSARIKTVLNRLRKPNNTDSEQIQIGALAVDRSKRTVTAGGTRVQLTHTEFELLFTLAGRPGLVFSRSRLIDSLRDGKLVITDRAIDVQIANLRKKLGNCGKYIETVRGVGYRMTEMP